MMRRTFFLSLLLTLFVSPLLVFAQESAESLRTQVNSRRKEVVELNARIADFQKKIEAAQTAERTLQGDLALLENKIAKTELDIASLEIEQQAVTGEISLIETSLTHLGTEQEVHRAALRALLRELHVQSRRQTFELLLSTRSLAELFDRLFELKTVSRDIDRNLNELEVSEETLQQERVKQDEKRTELLALSELLEQKKLLIEGERQAKSTILSQTTSSEKQFQRLLQDVKNEQGAINRDIAALQTKIEQRLAAERAAQSPGSPTASAKGFIWPVDRSYRGISALFHDVTYPYRHLFEHSGIDVPQRHGTEVVAAASGVVAWAKTGRSYGNYIMIIHENGLATLYAHLSSMKVTADDSVKAGQVIALSGGTPGTPGAGLSTGPHLHFEVRKNGVPVDPLTYLPR